MLLLNRPGRSLQHLLLWVGFLCAVLWTWADSPWPLVAAAFCLLPAAFRAGQGWRWGFSVALLAASVTLGFIAQGLDQRLAHNWPYYWEERRQEVATRLGSDFNEVVKRGDSSVDRLSRAASLDLDPAALRDSLNLVVEQPGVSAAAVFGNDGRLVAWGGSHHGLVPNEVVFGTRRYTFSGTPLFSYLYFSAEVPGAGAAVVASLIRSDLPEPFAVGLGGFAARFHDQTGERISITPSDRATGTEDFDFGWPDEALLIISVEEPEPEVRRADRKRPWVWTITALFLLAWILQTFGAPRSSLPYPVVALIAAAALLPLDLFLMPASLTDPAAFLLAGPFPLTLGRALLLGVASAPLVMLTVPRRNRRGALYLVPVLVALTFPLVLWWFQGAASAELLGTVDQHWTFFIFSMTLVLTLVTAAALTYGGRIRLVASLGFIPVGLGVAALMSIGVAYWVRFDTDLPTLLPIAWLLPAFLVGRGLAGKRNRLALRWFCAFWLAGSAVLPFAWAMRTQARMEIAEKEISRLGMAWDPYLDFLLDRFVERVTTLEEGAGGVELLYRAWTSSGLADWGASAFLTLWGEDSMPEQELRLGVTGERPGVVDELLPDLINEGSSAHRGLSDVNVRQLVVAVLPGGRAVTAAIPPQRFIHLPHPPSGYGPLFEALHVVGEEEFLTLVRSESTPASPDDAVVWSRNAEGWGGESTVAYPDGPYSLMYTISIPKLSVMLARATLLLALCFVFIVPLWLASAGATGGRLPGPVDWRGLFTSFRARVTWTLFAFFLASSIIFGTLAYRTLDGASERTATVLAERVVAEMAGAYEEEGGSLENLARRVGADLLEYQAGELAGGSVDELIALGLYESWVDPETYEQLEGGRQLGATKVVALGDWRYVLAHRRVPDGNIVASPVPLRAGAAALRRRDVADLLGFAIVIGPVLSLALAFLVGRALTRPIQTLRTASERVGSGNLAVHLPDDRVDEFGSVFAAFNRMVLRLSDARTELLRTTRRTTAIVEEAATGVIALDPAGIVTVANRQAELLLAVSLEEAAGLPRTNENAAELANWLDNYLESGLTEADTDFEWGERRVRGRARRIVQEGQEGGVVVNLEDVTDELRGERILAWGEMAKQVAHEVKSPLTPMKLSVQHLLRAWRDKRQGFGEVLERNVGAILAEIDRLASIARSFSRLGAPGAVGEGPLVAVDAVSVVNEVLDLYRAGGPEAVKVEGDMPAELPHVVCRADELREVLFNLLENARAATASDGVVRVGARSAEGVAHQVVITVEDDGVGIPEELLPRIFEPQFSTRSTGAGLGLAIVKRMVDSWCGVVEVESEAGVGTLVSVRLSTNLPAMPPAESQAEE